MIKVILALLTILHLTISCSQKVTPQNDTASLEKVSRPDLKSTILKETKKGGKYDFFSSIKGHEYDGVQIKPGVYSTKLSVALYQWGKANYDAGIRSLDEVYAIYSEHKQRPLNEREKAYLKMGFDRELEK